MAINKYKTKKGETRFKATLWHLNRPVISKSFVRKVDADQWLARENIKCIDQKVGRLKGSRLTVAHFFNETYFPNSGVRESTAKDYLRMFTQHIAPIFGERILSEIDAAEWSTFFRNKKKAGISNARINRIHAVASAIYSLAVKWDFVISNPLRRVDWEEEILSGEHKSWQEDELTRFLDYSHKHSPDVFPLFHFMYEAGLRISEALALQWDCVNFGQSHIEVRRAYTRILMKIEQNTKSGHRRTITVNPGIKDLLLGLYNRRKSKFVFTKENGEMLAYETVRVQFARNVQATQVPKIGIHGLRHTFASHFMMKGGNLYDLKSLLGHSSVETTMRYAHLSPNHLASKVALVQFRPSSESNVLTLKSSDHFPTIAENEAQTEIPSEVSESV